MKNFKKACPAKLAERSRGFTLIELLVVVAIISLLSSIVLASLSSARAKGRDAKRKSDLTQLRNAIALYQSDNNGNPPYFGTFCANITNQSFKDIITGTGTFLGKPVYMKTLPSNPTGGSTKEYYYNSNFPGSNNYLLCADMEGTGNGNGAGMMCGGSAAPSYNYCLKQL